MPESVILVPLLVVETVPGYLIRVQVPVGGKPLNTALPVAKVHVGGVIAPTTGAVGMVGCAGITALADAGDVHPVATVTVKVYVLATRFEIVVLVPSPVFIIPPGVPFTVQVPDEGNPFRMTLPVEDVHVGGVMVPIVGAVGKGRTVTDVEAAGDGPLHPLAVTLIVAVPVKDGDQVTAAVVPVPEIVFPVPVTDQL